MLQASGFTDRLGTLDTTLYDAVRSQTTREDRKALLAIQRAVTRRHPAFAYLEIGSYFGGSIQPWLLNPACTRIYSIDPRPEWQGHDGRRKRIQYPDNSAERMLDNLRALAPDQIGKLRCFDLDARDVDPALIAPRPIVAFVDGEHTRSAVMSDAAFCRRVLAEGGVVIFHDFDITMRAITASVREMNPAVAMLVGGGVFAAFFDEALVEDDPFLRERRRRYGGGHLTRLVRATRTAAWRMAGRLTVRSGG